MSRSLPPRLTRACTSAYAVFTPAAFSRPSSSTATSRILNMSENLGGFRSSGLSTAVAG